MVPASSPNWALLLKDMDLFPTDGSLCNTSPIQCPLCHNSVYQSTVPNEDQIDKYLIVHECKNCCFKWEASFNYNDMVSCCQNDTMYNVYVGCCAECGRVLCEYHSRLCGSESKYWRVRCSCTQHYLCQSPECNIMHMPNCDCCGENIDFCQHCIQKCECGMMLCEMGRIEHHCIGIQRKEKLKDLKEISEAGKRDLLRESGCSCFSGHENLYCYECDSGPWCGTCLKIHNDTCGEWLK